MKKLMNRVSLLALLMSGLGAGSAALASGPDFSSLSSAIDFETVAPVILAAGAALVTLYVIIKGVRIVLGMVRS